jgi:hypothetical protein
MRGYLDNLTSSGYLEGWAVDDAEPLKALTVAVLCQGQEIAWGLAHRFRKDLMESGVGTGWCAFRLKVEGSTDALPRSELKLMVRGSGTVLHVNPSISCIEDRDPGPVSVEALVLEDPTLLQEIWQLRGCEYVARNYIKRRGVEEFVRAAYLYVLERPADATGLDSYVKNIREGTLSAVQVIEALADSEEFWRESRQLKAPCDRAFPFIADEHPV